MVSSGIRKDIWAQRGFLEKLQYAEDDEYTRWCRARGFNVVYCPESVVMHSHNYTPAQAYKRSFGDARALAASWQQSPDYFNFRRTVLFGTFSDLRHDLAFCSREGRLRNCRTPRESAGINAAASSMDFKPAGKNIEPMKILVLTNLYPPHYVGGYELHCQTVVEALRARGHVVQVLTSDHGVKPNVQGQVTTA